MLFVDSTHTVKPGSEVNRIILEVLPRLQAGALVHFHDITFPYDYPPDILDRTLFFWNESALLLALLTGNSSLSVLFAMSMLHDSAPRTVSNRLPHYRPMAMDKGLRSRDGHYPTSIYLRAY